MKKQPKISLNKALAKAITAVQERESKKNEFTESLDIAIEELTHLSEVLAINVKIAEDAGEREIPKTTRKDAQRCLRIQASLGSLVQLRDHLKKGEPDESRKT